MKQVSINAQLSNGNGFLIILTIAGPNGYTNQIIFDQNTPAPAPFSVNPGRYSVYIHGFTDGQINISIAGTSNINPTLPASFNGLFSDIFIATV